MAKNQQSHPGSARPGSTAFLLAQVGAHAASRFGARLGKLHLERPHAGILRIIGISPGLTQQALGQQLGILPSRLVALLDELQEKGYVERRSDPGDRRSYALHLTDGGRRVLEQIGQIARDHDDEICAALNPSERQQLHTLLRRITEQQALTPGVHPGYRSLGRGARKR